MGYLRPKPYSEKNSDGTILPTSGGDKGIHTFTKGIYPKVNVLGRFVFEPIYNIAVHHISH